MILFRPVGTKELELIAQLEFKIHRYIFCGIGTYFNFKIINSD